MAPTTNPQPPVSSFEHAYIAATTATTGATGACFPIPNATVGRGPSKPLIQPHCTPKKRRSIARLQPRAESPLPMHEREGFGFLPLPAPAASFPRRPHGSNSRCGKANLPRRQVLWFRRDEGRGGNEAWPPLARWSLRLYPWSDVVPVSRVWRLHASLSWCVSCAERVSWGRRL